MKKKERFSLDNMCLRSISMDDNKNMSIMLEEKYVNTKQDNQHIGIGKAVLTFSKLKEEGIKINCYQGEKKQQLDLEQFRKQLLEHTVRVIEESHHQDSSYFTCRMNEMNVDIKIHHDNNINYYWELLK